MKPLVALAISGLVASGIALASPASAGCQGGWTPWGGGTNCFLANVNNLEGRQPYVGP